MTEIPSQFPSQPLGQGVFYQSQHPISWRYVESGAKLSELICRDNERLLRFFSSSLPSSLELPEEQSLLHSEFQRLELKLDLLLEQVGLLLAQQTLLPEAVPLRLTAQELHWWAREAPAPGETVQVAVYLKEELHRPVILLGKVRECKAEANGHRILMRFTDLGEGVREELERFIFRWHRRHIAQARRSGQPAGIGTGTQGATDF